MFRLVSEVTSVNVTVDEGISTSYANNPGCPSSMTEQLLLLATAGSSLERKEDLSGKYKFEQKLEMGTSMVDKEFVHFQWDFSSQTGFTSCALDGRFIKRLGCSSPGKINMRNIVFSRKKIAYQLKILAVKLALQRFLESQNLTSIYQHMDNIVSLTYLKIWGNPRIRK